MVRRFWQQIVIQRQIDNWTHPAIIGIFTGNGTFTFTSGEFYEGAWQNFQMEGMGKLSHPGSGTYSGEFVNAAALPIFIFPGIGIAVWVGDRPMAVYLTIREVTLINGTICKLNAGSLL